jgi:hypothetical protein
MSKQNEHSKQLIAAGRKILKPLGFVQIGSSRTFVSDEGIWSCVVNYQPHKYARGCFLNVGAHWLWSNMEGIPIGWGGRKSDFVESWDPEQFEQAAVELTLQAQQECSALRNLFTSTQKIAKLLDDLESGYPAGIGDWASYNSGIAYGLTGEWEAARKMFQRVLAAEAHYDWAIKRRADTEQLSALTYKPEEFESEIKARVSATRRRFKLP